VCEVYLNVGPHFPPKTARHFFLIICTMQTMCTNHRVWPLSMHKTLCAVHAALFWRRLLRSLLWVSPPKSLILQVYLLGHKCACGDTTVRFLFLHFLMLKRRKIAYRQNGFQGRPMWQHAESRGISAILGCDFCNLAKPHARIVAFRIFVMIRPNSLLCNDKCKKPNLLLGIKSHTDLQRCVKCHIKTA
jgi:hypothetical protein